MKKKTFTLLKGLILLVGITGFALQIGYSQNTDEGITVDPEEYLSGFDYYQPEIPVYIPIRLVLDETEKHVLDTLSDEERKILEEAVEPPAVGVVRDLKIPLKFNLNETDVPLQGEVSVPGARLSRVNEDTLVYTTYFQSMKADEIRIYFEEGNFPHGVMVNLFSENDYAFTQMELRGELDEYGFYTTTAFADHVLLQIVIPLNLIEGNLHFLITKLIHVDDSYIPKDDLRSCYEDANCSYANGYTYINDLRRSTARLYFPKGTGYYLCTGGQLNDTRGVDWQPFLLTANHCFSAQSSASGLEARFYYWSTSCNSGVVNPSHIIVNGANLLATNSQSDFTLVLLKQKGGNFYLGWSTSSVSNNETMHSVHHPSGTLQKYSRHQNKTSPDYTCTGFSTSNFHYTRTLGGQTSGGSSGGVIVKPSAHVVGQLYGWCYLPGADPCDYDTYYNMWGRFNVSYSNNNLQYWLYDGGASVAMSSTTSVNYGTVNVGSTKTLNVYVYNIGTVPNYLNLEAGSVTITGADASQFSVIGPTFLYLPPGGSGTFQVRFSPSSSGTKTASLNIPHNADNITSPRVVSLTGKGNPCSEVISLGGGGSANTKTFSKSGTGAWVTSTCGYDCNGREQVYSFVAPRTGTYSINVTSTNSTFVDYFWRSGSCSSSSWNCIGWVYGGNSVLGSMNFTAGTTYYILLDAESTSLSTHTFYIYLNPCQNITNIAGTGSGYAKTYTGGGNGAWYTNSASACGWWCPGTEKVYSFTAPNTGYYSVQVTSTNGGYVDYMWSESCSSSGWQCIDDVYSPGKYGSMYWTQGNTYYVLLDSEYTGSGSQTFYINAPDPCNGIIPITGCGSAHSATYSSSGQGVWNEAICGWSTPGSEQIYSFVAPESGQYSIEVTSASGGYYVDYMWKTGSCSSTGWTCIDDVYGADQYGSMSWTAGTTYYILLDDEDTNLSDHTFHIVCPALCHDCPTYDFLINPSTIWQNHSSAHAASGCKVYRFYAYDGRTYTFQTGCGQGATANYDTYLHLYDLDCVQKAYDDDGCGYPLSKIEWTADYNGYAYLKVRGYGGAGGDYTLAYNYCTSAPAQPGTISGPNPACAGASVTYSVSPVSGASDYTWSLPSGWTGFSTTNSIDVSVGANGGNISVIANNSCGSSPARALSVSVLSTPVQPGAISGPNSVCQGSVNTYSISPVPGASTYNWSLPAGWTGSSSGTSINATAGASGGSISVTASNICGTSPPSFLSVAVTPIPAQPGPISGPTEVLSGSTHTYSISSVSGATSYTWNYSGGGTPVGSGLNIDLTPTSSGILSVTANNICGSSPSRTLGITVYTVPVNRTLQNVLIASGQNVCYDALQTTTTAGGGTYFVVENGGSAYLVAGENVIMLPGTHFQSGSYVHAYIETSGEYCSNPKTLIAALEEGSSDEFVQEPLINEALFFKVYPNPTQGTFTLELNEVRESSTIVVEIFSIVGEKVLGYELPEFKEYLFDLSYRQPGVYLVRVMREDQIGVEKLVRQ